MSQYALKVYGAVNISEVYITVEKCFKMWNVTLAKWYMTLSQLTIK